MKQSRDTVNEKKKNPNNKETTHFLYVIFFLFVND